jgi:arabinogalactan endo-1,4-beta-galactosidase
VNLGVFTPSLLVAAVMIAQLSLSSASAAPATQPSGFVLGADITALDAPRFGNGRTHRIYQEDGVPSDELTILRRHGWAAFRLRVFVSPVRKAPNNTTAAAIPLAKRIKAAGAIFLLDLNFSDTWADPQHQEIPVAWRNLDFDGLENAWQQYAYDTIRQFKQAGAMPDWVQIGNEITRGTQWPLAQLKIPGSDLYPPPAPYDEVKQFDRLTRLLKAGIRGVNAAAGDTPPRIAIHIDQGGSWRVTEWFFDHINAAQVPYDIIAQSFYPPWHHGTLEQLQQNMDQSARKYGKDFLVVETGYGRSRVPNNDSMKWPQTPQGRLQFMVDLVNTVRHSPHGLGVMYWAPEYDLWNSDGSPGPAVFTMDHLIDLTTQPASLARPAIYP